jgi:hypothetical protein
MTDIGSVQVLSNAAPASTAQNGNAAGGRARAQAAESESRLQADSRSIAFTAKFSGADGEPGLRIVRGEEASAIESADLTALLDIRLSQAAAQALISLQEVQDDGDGAPAATDTEARPTGPAQIDTSDTGGTTASLDVEAPTTGGAEIDAQGTGGTTAVAGTGFDAPAPTDGGADTGGDAPDIEITLPDGTVTAGGTGGPPRGAVLDIIV